MRRKAKSSQTKLRKEFKTEEAHRVEEQMNTLKEEVFAYKSLANLDGYVRYFYEDTVSFLNCLDVENSIVFLDEPAQDRGSMRQAVETRVPGEHEPPCRRRATFCRDRHDSAVFRS